MLCSPDDGEEVKDYREQLKQMLHDLARDKEKEKDAEKPLPFMNQVVEMASCCTQKYTHTYLYISSSIYVCKYIK